MAELIVLEKDKKILSVKEEKIADYILTHSHEVYEQALQGADWDLFYQLSTMREGILNWYPFEKDSTILQLSDGFGALTGLLARRAGKVIVLEPSLQRAECIIKRYEVFNNITVYVGSDERVLGDEQFDYIVVEKSICTRNEIEQLLEKVFPFLKEEGKLLFVCENRFGMKYWCGVPDVQAKKPFAGIRGKGSSAILTRQQLLETLEQSELAEGFRIYYPFPDARLPQAIYTDEYLPGTSVRDRVIPYYTPEESKSLICLENEISDELIANGVFHIFANAFLVECGKKEIEKKTIFAALSTDRGKEHGFATVISAAHTVQKKILHSEGKKSLELIHQNQQELKAHGVSCVEEVISDDAIEMPYVKGKTLIEHLKELFLKDASQVEQIFDQLYEVILQSSEKVDFSACTIRNEHLNEQNAGTILKKAYIDMIPYNSFYKDGQIIFYDQEFVKECFPAKYVLYRGLRYTYIYIPEADKILPLQYFKEKYELEEIWQVFEQEEAQFVEDNRNYEMLSSFYQWAGISEKEVDEHIERLLNKETMVLPEFQRKRRDLSEFEEDTKLAAIKKTSLEILKEFVRVCEENNLSYCAFYGTLLGAVRHKGYVPWDDDVDVAMPRADYDKLVEIAPAVFKEPYFLQTPESDEGCFYGGYCKLRNSNTTGIEKRNEGQQCNQGIWIDILPIDFVPEDEHKREEQKKRIQLCQRLLMKKTYPEKRMLWDVSEWEEADYLRFSNSFSREYLCKLLREAFMLGSGTECKKVAVLARYWGDREYTEYDKKDFEFLVPGKYEDIKIYLPVGYERCLAKDYGEDYALYPAEAYRVPHHIAVFDTEKPYVDYLKENG